MKISARPNFTIVLLSIVISGCVVQSRQLGSLIELMSEPSINLSPNSWFLRYSNYESLVYAVETSEGILFANAAGDEVFFDGWSILSIKRIGNYKLNINIDDNRSVRSFKRAGKTISYHNCDLWERQRNEGMVRYSQNCKARHQDYQNSILVREDGNISVIRQIITDSYTPITLTKLH